MPGREPVVIIGGGISGLATAFYLKGRRIRSVIVEQQPRLGGLILTSKVLGCELEAGPDSFIAAKPAASELAGELGIADRIMGSNDAARQTFIVRQGQLIAMPEGMVMMVPTDWRAALESSFFSPETKRAFLRERFSKPRTRPGDFSIRELVSDHFGEESLAYLTEPLLSGVYGGHASELSARSVLPRFVHYEEQYGSLIRGARKSRGQTRAGNSLFLSLAGGMQTLIDALHENLRDTRIVHTRANGLRRTGEHWLIQTDSGDLQTGTVVLACPAYRAASLLAETAPGLSTLLDSIPYSSSTLVTLLFERCGFAHPLNGFGFLVPQPERRTIAAATWINTKFPSRVAPGLVALRVFLVDPQAALHMSAPDEAIIRSVLDDLSFFMGVTTPPVYARVHRWPGSMPQYTVGHQERCRQISSALSACAGLHLVSNYLDGVGIPDCIRLAEAASQSVSNGSAGG